MGWGGVRDEREPALRCACEEEKGKKDSARAFASFLKLCSSASLLALFLEQNTNQKEDRAGYRAEGLHWDCAAIGPGGVR